MFGNRNQLNIPIDVSQTAINELQNRPRQDITGERYGNTLSDDMFSIKNPNLVNRHTPESYEYFNQPQNKPVETWEPAAGWGSVLPTLNKNTDVSLMQSLASKYPVFRGNDLVSRQKNVTGDSLPWEVYRDWSLTDDILEFPDDYSQEQVDWASALRDKREAAQRVNDLSTEGMINEKFGNVPTTQSSYRDAEWDPYLETMVNYLAMSPQTMEQLAKMGVNRPSVSDDRTLMEGENGNDTYNSLLELYRLAMENGWR
jgi:hypothetical protein